jgi:nucleoside-diphosphate-sugar epimerase
MAHRQSILVLGANGFIGHAVVEQLAARGLSEVFVASRSWSPSTSRESTQSVQCRLDDPASIDEAVRGKSVVVHAARDATNELGQPPLGLKALLDSCRRHGVRRLIYLSSTAVYGHCDGDVDENTPSRPYTPYGQAKVEAERLCEAASAPEFQVAVLRPSLVYGSGGEEWTERFVRALSRAELTTLGPAGESRANLIYVDDLARFCVTLSEGTLPPFLVLNVNGDDRPTWNNYLSALARAFGWPKLLDPPSPGIRSVRRIGKAIGRRILRAGGIAGFSGGSGRTARWAKSLEVAFAPAAIDSVPVSGSNPNFVTDAAKRYGFEAKVSVAEGLRNVVQHHLSENHAAARR